MKLAARVALVLSVVFMFGVAGCGGSKTGGGGGGGGGKSTAKVRKLSDADQARLDEARKAAEDAERKLSDLRLERIELEKSGGGR
jgi:hypothetical protein